MVSELKIFILIHPYWLVECKPRRGGWGGWEASPSTMADKNPLGSDCWFSKNPFLSQGRRGMLLD